MQSMVWFRTPRLPSTAMSTIFRGMSSTAAPKKESEGLGRSKRKEAAPFNSRNAKAFAAFAKKQPHPRFVGEAGIIECNVQFLHNEEHTKALEEELKLNPQLPSMIKPSAVKGTQDDEAMRPILAKALKQRFVGPRYKERQVGSSGEPSVIELAGVIFIVHRE